MKGAPQKIRGWLTLAGWLGLSWLHCFVLGMTVSAQISKRPANSPRAVLAANLESSGNQYLLTLENHSTHEFRGIARLNLGQEGYQSEVGQLSLQLAPNDTRALLLNGVSVRGDQYTLQLFDQWGVLVFYKAAPVRPAASAAMQNAQAVTLVNRAVLSPTPTVNITSLPTPVRNEPPPPEIQIKLRLVAGAQEADPFSLAFELVAAKPILNATLAIALGVAKQSKPVNVNKSAVVEFRLPETLETNQVSYKLTRPDGSVISEGVSDLDKLYGDDHVTVADIRLDRVAYSAGEVAKVTVVLEGQAPHGFRLEVQAKDFSGTTFFSNNFAGGAGEQVKEREFSFAMPADVKGPVIFEFKVYDAETGLLFDSGERDIVIKETSKG